MQIQFDEDQARELKRVAEERGVSVAALTREAVGRLLSERGELTRAERRALALDAMGRFAGDGSPVAVEHDRYLDEAYGDWVEHIR